MNYLAIFLTGLTTGGLSCLAVQGGLLASVIANQKKNELASLKKGQQSQSKFSNMIALSNFRLLSFDHLDWMPVAMFLLTKLAAHLVLGFLLGSIGSAISLSLDARLFFQTFTALFMIATAMNLLRVHPIFRYVAFQPPKFLQKVIRNSKNSQALFAPAVLGAMTVFIPCGVTQAMEVLAINSGNAIEGALIMLFFVLGTMPLFGFLGVATAKLSEGWHKKFEKIAAISLIVMAIYTLNGVLVVVNSPITLNKIFAPVRYFFSDERFNKNDTNKAMALDGGLVGAIETKGVQKVVINILDSGYQPNYIRVKNNLPVELTLKSDNTYSCALAFVFREFGINTFLEKTDQQTFKFTPQKKGRFTFTCSMGMYSGIMEVI